MSQPSAASTGPTDRYVVVSADSHVGPMMRAQLREYCPAQRRDDYDWWVDEVEQEQSESGPGFVSRVPEFVMAALRARVEEKGAWDVETRLRHMDEDGVAAEVVYHGTSGQRIPFNRPHLVDTACNPTRASVELEALGIRMYNQWLADMVSVAPHRFVGLAQLPLTSPLDRWIAEVEWARSAGLGGVNLPAPVSVRPQYFEPYWEPFWAACASLDMTLNTHGGSGEVLVFDAPPQYHYMFKQFETGYFGRRHVHQMVLSGVFERHPNLRLAVTEQAGHWVQGIIRDMESSYFQPYAADLRKEVKRRPRDVWATNCFVGASMMSDTEARLSLEPDGHQLNLMWGRDYPHVEGTWPHTRLCMRKTFAGLAPDNVAPLIGGTAIRMYGLDPAALREIASHIGPTVAELAEPPGLADLPSHEEYPGFGFRSIGQWG
jgi:predicted TIM-barrel fold metal-dependent hydrolase